MRSGCPGLKLATALLCVGIAGMASAHHSYGMFDRTREVQVTGTVEKFQWTNPHARLLLNVQSGKRAAQMWDIEIGSPGHLARGGWKRLSLQAGDKVSVLIYPMRDGKPGGHLLMVTTPQGKDLYDTVFKPKSVNREP